MKVKICANCKYYSTHYAEVKEELEDTITTSNGKKLIELTEGHCTNIQSTKRRVKINDLSCDCYEE